jgi:ferritin-like metal-binding protein YciE
METVNNSSLNSSLEVFMLTMLQEMYWSEVHLVNVLDTMHQVASTTGLKEAFANHRQQTQTHVQRLENVFQLLQMPAEPEMSVGLQGLFDEGWQVIDESQEGSAQRDAALIIAAQKVEHYEIACYGSMVTLARTIGRNDIANILIPTLQEEKETDLLLTGIAEGSINEAASEEPAEPMSQAGDQPAGRRQFATSDVDIDADAEQQRKEALTERD